MKRLLFRNKSDKAVDVQFSNTDDAQLAYTGNNPEVMQSGDTVSFTLTPTVEKELLDIHEAKPINLDDDSMYAVEVDGVLIPYSFKATRLASFFNGMHESGILMQADYTGGKAEHSLEAVGGELFAAKYWRVDGPSTASFSIVNYLNGFEVNFECRMTNDLIGVVWDSIDTKNHKYVSRGDKTNYTGVKFNFDISLSDTMPDIDDGKLAPTLTVEYIGTNGQKSVGYVALKNYVVGEVNEDGSYHVELDFDNLYGGYDANFKINPLNVSKIFFSAYTDKYAQNNTYLPNTISGKMRVYNITTSGNNMLPALRVVNVEHDVGMCTSYDDHYDLNPQLIVDNLVALGYSGFINHYCGMSHYPAFDYNAEAGRFQIKDTFVTGEDVVNEPTLAWHRAFAKALKEANFQPVFSVSWELYSQAAREEWCQREWDDSIGRTGYEPPSYFVSMCHENAIAYIHKAYREFAQILKDAGHEVIMQIGEPWHWFNPATNNPCVYDYQTRLAFNADTGLYAPDLGTIFEAVEKVGTPYDEFKTWLRNKLGQTCQDIRTMLKAEFGESTKVCPLIFFPTIRTHTESLATYINYPVEHYSYPNFDFIMTEAYDWIMEKTPRLDLTHETVKQIPTVELGYPPEKVAYLSGFVPDKMIAYIYKFDYKTNYRPEIWQRIFGDIKNNSNEGIMKQLVWAYPQVMEDSIVIDKDYDGFFTGGINYPEVTGNVPYSEEIFSDNAQPYVPPVILQPNLIHATIDKNYDITVHFSVSNDIEGTSYDVQLLDEYGLNTLLVGTTTTHDVKFLAADLAAVGLGTMLRVLIIPSVGESSIIVDIVAVGDPSTGEEEEGVDLNTVGLDITLSGVLAEPTYLALAEKLGGVIGEATTVEKDAAGKVTKVTHFNEELDPYDVYADSFVIDTNIERISNEDLFTSGLKFIDSYRIAKESVDRIKANPTPDAVVFKMTRFMDVDETYVSETVKDYTLAELEEIGVYDEAGDLYFGFIQKAIGEAHSDITYEAVADLNDEGGLTYVTTYGLNGKLPTKVRLLSADVCKQIAIDYPEAVLPVTSQSLSVPDEVYVNASQLGKVTIDHTLTQAEVDAGKVELTLSGGLILDKIARNIIDNYGGYENDNSVINTFVESSIAEGSIVSNVNGRYDSYAYYQQVYHRPLTEDGDSLLIFNVQVTIDLSKVNFEEGIYQTTDETGVIQPVTELRTGSEVTIGCDDVGFNIPIECTLRQPS